MCKVAVFVFFPAEARNDQEKFDLGLILNSAHILRFVRGGMGGGVGLEKEEGEKERGGVFVIIIMHIMIF